MPRGLDPMVRAVRDLDAAADVADGATLIFETAKEG
jgi:hypothetical protein